MTPATLGRLAALLLLALSVGVPAARAEVLAVDPQGAATPVLWGGGVAWQDREGVSAAADGSAPRRLVSFRALGFTYAFSLDSGSGAGAGSAGALAYGWEEANDETPPMGPGDTTVPIPPLPYETSISHRGVIGAPGNASSPQSCGAEASFRGYRVSLAAGGVAYLCSGVPAGAQASPPGAFPSYLALSELAAPAGAALTIAGVSSEFQISGDFVAYVVASPLGTGRVLVASRSSGAVSYEVPLADARPATIALEEDGTLVLLDAGGTPCAGVSGGVVGPYPAEWFSPASPVAHQLGCFYDGSLRPVAGRWVALSPGPGDEASLELVSLVDGASHTLAVFANAGVFEPGQQGLTPAADFDGHQLAFLQATCAGSAVELDADVDALTPGPPSSPRCPAQLHAAAVVRVAHNGLVRVGVSCPLGCPLASVAVAQPRAFAGARRYLTLAPSRTRTISLRLSRRQLADLRRRRRVRVTLSVLSNGLGSAPQSKAVLRVMLAS